MPNELLEIYLTDHCAAAAAGSRRMRRLADAERSAEDGSTLERIANEIEEDRTTLLSDPGSIPDASPWSKPAIAVDWLGQATAVWAESRPLSGTTGISVNSYR